MPAPSTVQPDRPLPERRGAWLEGHLPSSLQVRLLLAFGLLALLTALLANGAALALYGHRLERDARTIMANQALSLSNVLTEAAGDEPMPAERLERLLFTDVRLRRAGQPLTLIDASGRQLASISPSFGRGFGRDREQDGSATSSSSRPGPRRGAPTATPGPAVAAGPGAAANGILRRPFGSGTLRLVPQPSDADGRPVVSELELEGGGRLLYTTIPLPVTIAPDASWARFIDERAEPPLHLAIVRPRAELSGLWRSMLPSVALVGLAALSVAMWVAWVLARSITRPVAALTAASERIASGDYAVSVEADRRDELGRLARSFNSMAQAVAEADRRQRDFVINVGHDLRTPLTTVRGFAGALLDGTARSEAQREQAIRAIESAGDRMVTLVESLVELARLESQSAGLRLQRAPIAPLLEQAAEACRPLAEASQVRIEVEAAAGLDLWMDGDWLLRAISNLVENAVHFSPAGGRVLLVASTDTLPGDRPAVRIDVIDRGPGIAAKDLPRIFERFYRADRARRAGGSGLGLAIASEIVAAHAGTLVAESPAGGGARLTLRLPREPAG